MIKYLMAAILVLGLLLTGSAALLKREYGRNAVLVEAQKAAQEQRKRDGALLARRTAEKAATAREMASLRASLGAALAKNREWAEQPVPQEVQDALP